MLCVRAVTKAMSTQDPVTHKGRHGEERSLGRGVIVNLGSGLSFGAGPGMMAYVASKHSVMGITKVAGKFIFSSENMFAVKILIFVKHWIMRSIKFELMLYVLRGSKHRCSNGAWVVGRGYQKSFRLLLQQEGQHSQKRSRILPFSCVVPLQLMSVVRASW